MAKKMKIDFKQIDWQAFLLHKGEKVGLYAALGIMVLLVVLGLFWPGKGIFSGSPSTHAKELSTLNEDKERLIRTRTPSESEKEQLVAIDPTLFRAGDVEPVSADRFATAGGFFEGKASEDHLRRAPRIVPPTEYHVAVLQTQLKSFIFDENFKKVQMVKYATSKSDGPPMPGGSRPPGMGGFDPRFYGRGGGGYNPGAMMGMGGMGMRGGGMRGYMPPSGFVRGGLQRGLFTDKSSDKKSEPIWVNMDDIPKQQQAGFVMAEAAVPVRMVVVSASFPFKEQLEEARKALRLGSLHAAMQETRFRGFTVLRQEVGPDGKTELWDEKKHVIPIDKVFTELLVLNGRRYDKQPDEGLDQVLITGLYMAYPKQFRDNQYPKGDDQLEKVQKALEEAKARNQPAVQPAQKSQLGSREGIDPYDPASGAPVDPTGGGTVPPGTIPPNGDAPPGTLPPGAPPGGGPRMSPPGTMVPPGGSFWGNLPQDWAPPDYCLLRFIDPTAEAGKTYVYRYQVKLTNPNYKRDKKEVAYPDLAKDPLLLSPWFDVPQKVKVPPDRRVFVVDEKKLDPKFNDNRSPTTDQVALQLQCWVDVMRLNSKVSYPVADWAIVERLLAYRGEYVPGRHKVELPIHDVEHPDFILATDPKSRGEKKVAVDFLGDDELLLVNFDGGRSVVQKFVGLKEDKPETTPVEDQSVTEVLFLSADGKLLARNNAADANDKDRKAHRETWKKRIKEAKEGDKKTPGNTDKDNLFGPGKGPGGTGK